jgi:Putative prokaryotic signal transducing protein
MEIVDKKRTRSAAPEGKPSGGTAPVPVAVVGTTSEAELIVGMLRSNNVRAAVSADDAGGQEPELQLQGVRVLVAAADAAEARRLLAAANDTAADDTAADDTA